MLSLILLLSFLFLSFPFSLLLIYGCFELRPSRRRQTPSEWVSGLVSDLVYYVSVSRAEGPFGPLPTFCCYPSIHSSLRILVFMTGDIIFHITRFKTDIRQKSRSKIKDRLVIRNQEHMAFHSRFFQFDHHRRSRVCGK